jgi:hypothetical protein
MRAFLTDSYRGSLHVLFYLFEALLIASIIVLACVDPRGNLPASDAAGVAFLVSFVGLFAVCFFLRRNAHRLAIIGWLTLFVGFWYLIFTPVL